MFRDSAEKRLSELFEQSAHKLADRFAAKIERDLAWVKSKIDAIGRLTPNTSEDVEFIRTLTSGGFLLDPDDLTPTNPTILSMTRNMALEVSDTETDMPIRTAFRKAGLDETNPLHWRILIWMFARAHFGPKPKLGTPQIWTADRYCELLYDFAQVKSRSSHLTDSAVCRVLLTKKSYGRPGKQIKLDRLRKALREARSPKHNDFIATQLARKLLQQQSSAMESGKDKTSQVVRQHEKELTDSLIKWIGTNWRQYNAKRDETQSMRRS
jgi:hypothetical protein